jgi:hypothetical protein
MRIKLSFFTSFLGLAAVMLLSVFFAPHSLATVDLTMSGGASSARGADQVAALFGASGIFTTLSNGMLFLVGAISVIMVVIGGFRYVVSGGNTANVAAAKNTILYAVVGLVVAMLAYAIINFVIGSFIPGESGGGGVTNV